MAIKRINITRLKKRLKENLALEISIMKHMHHPNIVMLFDTLVWQSASLDAARPLPGP